jgi:hypothetical protein
MSANKTPESSPKPAALIRCTDLVRQMVKKFVTFCFVLNAHPTTTAEDRAYLRRDLRCWNQWPQKGWSVLSRMPKIRPNNNTATPSAITLNANLSFCQLGKMQPTQESQMQNSAPQEYACWINLWKALTELERQSKRPQAPLQIILMTAGFPCADAHSPNAAGKPRPPSILLP